MFSSSEFNGDISGWNISCVTNMEYMFSSSEFNGDISGWNISCVTNMRAMFDECLIQEEHKPQAYKRGFEDDLTTTFVFI